MGPAPQTGAAFTILFNMKNFKHHLQPNGYLGASYFL